MVFTSDLSELDQTSQWFGRDWSRPVSTPAAAVQSMRADSAFAIRQVPFLDCGLWRRTYRSAGRAAPRPRSRQPARSTPVGRDEGWTTRWLAGVAAREPEFQVALRGRCPIRLCCGRATPVPAGRIRGHFCTTSVSSTGHPSWPASTWTSVCCAGATACGRCAWACWKPGTWPRPLLLTAAALGLTSTHPGRLPRRPRPRTVRPGRRGPPAPVPPPGGPPDNGDPGDRRPRLTSEDRTSRPRPLSGPRVTPTRPTPTTCWSPGERMESVVGGGAAAAGVRQRLPEATP